MFRDRENCLELSVIEFFDGDFVDQLLDHFVEVDDFDVTCLDDRFEDEPGFFGIDVCGGGANEVFWVTSVGWRSMDESDIDVATVGV